MPKNDSRDALHADHVNPFTAEILSAVETTAEWVKELDHLRAVVCVTAAENYKLQQIEHDGTIGPGKYEKAGITWASTAEPQLIPFEGITLPTADADTA